jgi:hypothetical protein
LITIIIGINPRKKAKDCDLEGKIRSVGMKPFRNVMRYKTVKTFCLISIKVTVNYVGSGCFNRELVDAADGRAMSPAIILLIFGKIIFRYRFLHTFSPKCFTLYAFPEWYFS